MHRHRVLLCITLAGVVLRVLFAQHHAGLGWQLHYDPSYYLTLADHLRHGVYSLFHPLAIPDTTHMPGYPFLIHLLGGSIPLLLTIQVVASAVKIPVMHALALRMGLGSRWALLAALLMALEPLDILYSGQVLTEALFTTALLLGLWAWLSAPSLVNAVLMAFCLATCAWLRPNGALLIPVVLVTGALFRQQRLKHLLIAGAVAVLLIAPWVVRQHHITGRWILSDGGVVAVAYFHLPGVLLRAGDPQARDYREQLHARASATDWEDAASARAFYHALRVDTRRVLSSHPGAWAAEQSIKSARILVAPGRGHINAFFSERSVLRGAILGASALFSLAIVMALGIVAYAGKAVPRPLLSVLAVAAVLLLTGGLSVAEARFKVPAMPILLLTTVWSTQWIARRWHRATPPAPRG